jgi:hypothetical protein
MIVSAEAELSMGLSSAALEFYLECLAKEHKNSFCA